MNNTPRSLDTPAAVAERVEELFREQQHRVCASTDHWFATLMTLQWIGGIVAALVISPHTWIGERSQVHVHVWAAVLLGGAISGLPVLLALWRPGQPSTRYVIAVAQMMWSALLIHLTGGRIETHFHVFGSLAFLAFYRDWRVLVPATLVVAADHLLRGLYYPESVFGVLTASPWRWVEHAAWVLFEDTFLIASCVRGVKEMRSIAERTAQLEATNQNIEKLVVARTAELENVHKRLLDFSHSAGMAEVATSVLHNVGNVLNSVNVSTGLIKERVSQSRLSGLERATELVRNHADNLGAFFDNDPQGKQLPQYFELLTKRWKEEQATTLKELESLTKSVNHIKDIIGTQQSLTGVSGVAQQLSLSEVLDEALEIGSSGFEKNRIRVVRDYRASESVMIDKMKLMMIVVNLLRNAKDALAASDQTARQLVVRSERNGDDCVYVRVADNGVGIPSENLTRMFSWGFTTKTDGHGYGLHSSALAAREIGGSLQGHSDGLGHGAEFVLEIPINGHKKAGGAS